jgi:hypothetical protein
VDHMQRQQQRHRKWAPTPAMTGLSGMSAMAGGILTEQLLASVANKLAWYRASKVTGIASGGDVPASAVRDQSANGNHATGLGSGGATPTLNTTGLNGRPTISCAQQGYILPAVYPSGGVGLVWVGSFSGFGGGTPLWGSGAASDHVVRFTANNSIRVRASAADVHDFAVSVVGTGVATAVCVTFDTTLNLINLWLNGQWIGQAAITAGAPSGTFRLCDNSPSGNTFGGDFADGFAKAASLTPVELWSAHNAYNTLFAYNAATAGQLVFDGASLMGQGNFRQQVQALLTTTPAPGQHDVAGGGIARKANGVSQATMDQARTDLNALFAADHSMFDAYIDTASLHTSFGAVNGWQDTAVYQVDGVHWNTTGAAAAATPFAQQCSGLLL